MPTPAGARYGFQARIRAAGAEHGVRCFKHALAVPHGVGARLSCRLARFLDAGRQFRAPWFSDAAPLKSGGRPPYLPDRSTAEP